MPFEFKKMSIPEVQLITPRVFSDGRGYFLETYKSSDFIANGIAENFVQDNHACSDAGVLRGLHFQQAPHAQGKLVRVIAGSVFDVAVDIRQGSPTFGQWVGAELSADNRRMLWVPPGFAHGVLALEDHTQIHYKATAEYHPESEKEFRWDDPVVGVEWPIDDPILSERDQKAPALKDADINYQY